MIHLEGQLLAWGLVALWVACRAAPLVLWAPFWGGRALPPAVRVGVLVALTALLTPLVGAELAPEAQALWGGVGWVAVALKELAVGAAVAVAASAMFWGVEMAGQISDTARGFPQATVSAPAATAKTTPLGALGVWLSAAVFVAAGGHLVVLGALARSFQAVPVLEAPTFLGTGLLAPLISLTAEIFALALLIALPVLASVWIAGILTGVLHRASPGLQAFFTSLPTRSLIGVLAALAVLHVAVDLAVDGALGAVQALEGLWP